MIELKGIRKAYATASFTQTALDDVSLAFRDNEFVAVLGPSGSGKTTLLNILGGLDHTDSGDIVINGVSTSKYKDADWDTYRNHRIGFIFQSYNLIPHQTVKANVELALTLSGVSREERTQRAVEALERVGLGDHVSKKPAQLSGGQMQRVAIARALINDPDIVLADEPTGALDTETGLQVMDLLSEIAQDRLVIMVTHNPELAERYANRIVNLADGRITGDTNPLAADAMRQTLRVALPASAAAAMPATSVLQGAGSADTVPDGEGAPQSPEAPEDPFHTQESVAAEMARDAAKGTKKHASMSFLTALALSFNNLMTKKGRTFLTAFAGSIGIIGIAAILSLSNGVNNYIAKTEEEALTSYPLTITKSSFDIASLMTAGMNIGGDGDADSPGGINITSTEGTKTGDGGSHVADADKISQVNIMTDMFAKVKNNDLKAFREYLEGGTSGIENYVNLVQYGYGLQLQVFKPDTSNGIVQLSPSSMTNMLSSGMSTSAFSLGGAGMDSFQEIIDSRDIMDQQFDMVLGHWPETYDEAVLVLGGDGQITDYTLYSLGIYDSKKMEEMTRQALEGEEVTVPDDHVDFTYEDAMGMTFSVVPATAMYQKNEEQGTWTDMSKDKEFMKQAIADGVQLKIVGVVQPTETNAVLSEGVAYTSDLTRHLMDVSADSQIVKEQMANPDVDVFTGKTFEELQDDEASGFDMESMFDIDEDALANAFSFDTSALDSMGSGLNLDASSLGIDADSMSIDPGAFQMDSSVIEGIFSEENIAAIMAGAPQFSLDSMNLSESGMTLTDEQRQAVDDASQQLAAGFTAWLAAGGYDLADPTLDYTTLLQEYLSTDETAQGIVSGLSQEFGSSAQEAINQAMQQYMTEQFAPYLAQQTQALMGQAAEAMANQMAQAMTTQIAAMTDSLGTALASAISGQLSSSMAQLSSAMESGFTVDTEAFANAIKFNMSQEDLTSLLMNYMNAEELSYDANLAKLGYAAVDDPETISIYPKDFVAKESVLDIIDAYNESVTVGDDDSKAIGYTDIAGVLMSSVNSIINMISLVLIAFVSISLIVSSIMIGIITYISVLERKKEIGILRAIGASKGNIANVFNAETILEGLLAGVFAIAVVKLVSLPVNSFVLATKGVDHIMILPWDAAAILVGISVALTFVAGLIPSTAASRRDPVEALRSE